MCGVGSGRRESGGEVDKRSAPQNWGGPGGGTELRLLAGSLACYLALGDGRLQSVKGVWP